MKTCNVVVALVVALFATCGFAQTGTPPVPDAPPTPAPPATPTEPPPPSGPKVVEGVLMKSQRANNDKGKYEWICTYRVEKITRSVLLDESCPQNLPFEMKK